MADQSEQVRILMADGLDLYGIGKVEQAVACWREVIAIEPGHDEALDYLRAAGEEPDEIELEAVLENSGGALSDVVALFRDGEFEEGLELLMTLSREEPGRMELQGYIELARSRMVGLYRERVGDPARAPRVRIAPEEIMKFNLPAQAGFLLSLVDGRTSIAELIQISGMDPFEAMQLLTNLLSAGIVDAEAA